MSEWPLCTIQVMSPKVSVQTQLPLSTEFLISVFCFLLLFPGSHCLLVHCCELFDSAEDRKVGVFTCELEKINGRSDGWCWFRVKNYRFQESRKGKENLLFQAWAISVYYYSDLSNVSRIFAQEIEYRMWDYWIPTITTHWTVHCEVKTKKATGCSLTPGWGQATFQSLTYGTTVNL